MDAPSYAFEQLFEVYLDMFVEYFYSFGGKGNGKVPFVLIVNVHFLVLGYVIDNCSTHKNPGLRRLWY